MNIVFRGTEEYCGVPGAADIICSTLGKAVSGAAGGYTTGPKELVTLLRNVSRPYLFSNAPPPPVVGAALKVKIIIPCLKKGYSQNNNFHEPVPIVL